MTLMTSNALAKVIPDCMRQTDEMRMRAEAASSVAMDAGFYVHTLIGPGALEHVYHALDETLVIEVKAAVHPHPIHHAQLLSYLRLSGHRMGLLMNFHVEHLKDGIRRILNDR